MLFHLCNVESVTLWTHSILSTWPLQYLLRALQSTIPPHDGIVSVLINELIRMRSLFLHITQCLAYLSSWVNINVLQQIIKDARKVSSGKSSDMNFTISIWCCGFVLFGYTHIAVIMIFSSTVSRQLLKLQMVRSNQTFHFWM